MRKTALHSVHQTLGAKIIPFAGYEMPVSYSSIKQEHARVRESAGVFDVSHMGQFFISGPEATKLILTICTNDILKISPGGAQYSCMTNNRGGIIDDLIIYRIKDNEYMLVVNASNIEKDWMWIQENNPFNAFVENRSEATSLLAIQGPKACSAMRSLTSIDLNAMPFYSFNIGTFAGVENVLIATTGYTGSGGVEIYFPNQYAEQIFNRILEAGKSYDILPVGLGARDTLRLEKGYCLYGNDIDESTHPIEAGLGWITKFNHDFIGKSAIEQYKKEGIQRKLVGFEMIEKGIPRKGYPIVNKKNEAIGVVTSGTMSPSLGKSIGLGYVQTAYSTPETAIFVQIRNKILPCITKKVPFL